MRKFTRNELDEIMQEKITDALVQWLIQLESIADSESRAIAYCLAYDICDSHMFNHVRHLNRITDLDPRPIND